ncbi:MAG: bifunctional YncE family protein/alkaline phosphatase family protein [Bryobacteraceae bacterium]
MSNSKSPTLYLAASLISATIVSAQALHDYRVGPQADGSFVVPTNQIVTPAGRQISFNGRPLAVAVNPNRNTAAVLNTGSGESTLPTSPVVIVDLVAGNVKQEFNPGNNHASYDGVIYSQDGTHLYFSQDDGLISIAKVASDGTLALDAQIKLPAAAGAVNNGGLALSPDQTTLYVVLNMANSLGVIDLTKRKFTRKIAVGNAPTNVAIVGDFAYVTNQGGRTAKPGEFTDLSAGTPIVADRRSAASITGTVSVINLSTHALIHSIPVGLQPTAILSSNGFVIVANSNSDSVSVIDSRTNTVIETLHIQTFPNAPFGSSPNGLAMTSRNELVVTLGANNAAAFYQWTNGHLNFEGLVPTAWYPASVAIVSAQTPQQTGAAALPERLIVVNTKGTSVGSAVPDEGTPRGKNTHTFVGSVSVVPLPTTAEFARYNTQVASNNGWTDRDKPQYKPLPFRDHLIKHVFYVIKENRTYDQVLGDDARGNGDPKLVQFGTAVTPNQHALADAFVLFDNFYDSGLLSADGHQWTDQAIAPDYVEKQFTDFNRSYPYNGGDSLAYSPTGFIWMEALAHGLSVRIYGEFAPRFDGPSQEFGSWTSWYNDSLILEGKKTGTLHVPIGRFRAVADVPSVEEHLNRDFPNFNTGIPDQYRLDIFLKDFESYVENSNLPNLIVMTLCTDHTSGTSVGFPTPAAQVADNDVAVGRLVDAVSHSPYWSSSAIFIVEDDAQSGADHVDGHRSTAFIASPYVKRSQVNHSYYTQINMLRTIEELLGLPPMNQHDLLASAMTNAFEDSADVKPFSAIPNRIPLDTLNPAPKSKLEKAWRNELAKFFPHGPTQAPDVADPNLLNHAIWYATKGFSTPYPGERRVFYPNQLNPRVIEQDDK